MSVRRYDPAMDWAMGLLLTGVCLWVLGIVVLVAAP